MSRPKTLLLSSMCRTCRKTYMPPPRRGFSTTPTPLNSERLQSQLAQRSGIKYNDGSAQPRADPFAAFTEVLEPPTPEPSTPTNNSMRNTMKVDLQIQDNSEFAFPYAPDMYGDEPYHINVYAHRHNTHITFTTPARDPIISFSCGNIGLRKAQRASFDASFQLAAYTFRKMAEKQWKVGGKDSKGDWLTLSSIRRPGYSGTAGAGIEIIMRGFGPGREAFQKALLGTEGRMIKPLIAKVTDGTRLKFGGTRSPQVRRL